MAAVAGHLADHFGSVFVDTYIQLCHHQETMSTPYEPEIRTDAWLSVQDFVLSTVAAASPKVIYDEKDLMLVCSRLAVWAERAAGLPVKRDVLFRREVISQFIATGLPTFNPAARGNMRSQLLRMSEVLLDRSSIPRRLAPLPPAEPAKPYTAHELISLRSWASGQSTSARRANAKVLIAAGAGAGLSASEIGNLRAREIRADDVGVTLHISGERARTVPVLEEWCDALRDRVGQLPSDSFAFRENHTEFYPNLVSNFVGRSGRVGIKPQTQRMRATWIVRHLGAGTRVVELMQAAGVESLEAFTRYLKFVPGLEPSKARELLSSPG